MTFPAVDLRAVMESPAVRVWRHPNYARFMSGLGPYYVSGWMQRVAVGWLAWELSHSNAWVGAIAAADLGPMMFLAPIAGAIADRSNPLRLIRITQLGLLLQAVLLAAAALSGFIDVWLLFFLSLVSGTIQPFYNSARQTTIPLLVPRSDFASAVSLDSSFFQGSRFIGPAIAAFTIQMVGSGGTCAVHVIGCLFFFLMCSRIDAPAPERAATYRSLFADVVESFAFIRSHPGLRPLFLMMMAASVVARPLQDLLPGFSDHVFGAGPLGLAWLTSSMGVGALTAAGLVATRGRSEGLATLAILATCGLALSIFGFVATHRLALAIPFAVMFGFTFTMIGVGIQVQAQVCVADGLRGRVMAMFTLVYRGMPAAGALLLGFMSEHLGLRTAFAMSAGICLVVWLVTARRAAKIERALAD